MHWTKIEALLDRCGVPKRPFGSRDTLLGEVDEMPFDLPLGGVQEPRREEIRPTGGKRCEAERPVFEGAQRDLPQPLAWPPLAACAASVRVYERSKNSPTNNPFEGDATDIMRS